MKSLHKLKKYKTNQRIIVIFGDEKGRIPLKITKPPALSGPSEKI
jgi:hypothetical protein